MPHLIAQRDNREVRLSDSSAAIRTSRRTRACQLAAAFGKCTRIAPPLPNAEDVNERAVKQNRQGGCLLNRFKN
jgi:hypothetical protein